MWYNIEKNYIKNVFDGIFNIKSQLVSDLHIIFKTLLEMIGYFTEALHVYICYSLIQTQSKYTLAFSVNDNKTVEINGHRMAFSISMCYLLRDIYKFKSGRKCRQFLLYMFFLQLPHINAYIRFCELEFISVFDFK